MKKALVLIIVLLFLSATSVYAEYESFTLDELLDMRAMIENEILSRISNPSSTIYPGDNLVGVDIKAGTYLITCTKENERASDGMIMAIFHSDEVYEANKNTSYVYGDYRDNAVQFIGIELSESALLTLVEGDHLIISWGEGLCVPHRSTWMP